MSHTDRFWKLFWTIVGVFVLLYFIGIALLAYFYNPTKTADAAAVGVIFDPSRDPFAVGRPSDKRPKFSGEYFYQDSLPLAFADWSWGVRINWNATDVVYEGSSSYSITFLQEWSGMRVQASDIDLTDYQGISLSVRPSDNVGDLYIEVFDKSGNSLGKQSLGWYAPDGKLQPNQWNNLSIPFDNLFPENQGKRPITGYSISTVHPGVAYVDAVHLEKEVAAHSRWYEPKPFEWQPEKPAPPIPLPYSLSFDPQEKDRWRTIFGRFEITPTGMRIGSLPEKSTGSMSYIRGGQNWTDYTVSSLMYWGQTSAFSILVRYTDDANFISCAFSHYNDLVQMYDVRKGVSTLMGTSPGLPIADLEPWKDAKAGARVEGKRVSCLVNGETILSYEIPDIAPTGSVGIETWTQNTYDSPHTLQQFSVRDL